MTMATQRKLSDPPPHSGYPVWYEGRIVLTALTFREYVLRQDEYRELSRREATDRASSAIALDRELNPRWYFDLNGGKYVISEDRLAELGL